MSTLEMLREVRLNLEENRRTLALLLKSKQRQAAVAKGKKKGASVVAEIQGAVNRWNASRGSILIGADTKQGKMYVSVTEDMGSRTVYLTPRMTRRLIDDLEARLAALKDG